MILFCNVVMIICLCGEVSLNVKIRFFRCLFVIIMGGLINLVFFVFLEIREEIRMY